MKEHKKRGLRKKLSDIFCDSELYKQDSAVCTLCGENVPAKDAQTDQDSTANTVCDKDKDAKELCTSENEAQIKRIMSQMDCIRNFACYTSGFKDVCSVRIIAEGKLLECTEENKQNCQHGFSFSGKRLCKCMLRHYLAKNMNI